MFQTHQKQHEATRFEKFIINKNLQIIRKKLPDMKTKEHKIKYFKF